MSAPTSPTIHREFDLPRFAAGIAAIASLLGAAVGAHLTSIKFTMTYTPCLSEAGGCQFGSMSCGSALESPVSILLGLPISAWGSAFYLVTAVLAASLVIRRDAFNSTAAHILLLFAGLGISVSVALAAYTTLVLPNPCPFCMVLYAISLLLLGTALAIFRAPGARAPSYHQVLRSRPADLVHCAFVALLVLVSVAGVQSLVYHGLRNSVDAQMGCPAPRDPLPRAGIKHGDADPAVIVAVFLDMSCTECRKEFRVLSKAYSEQKFRVPVQLRFYHTPRHACDPEAFVDGYRKTQDQARNDNACLAARAAECMEKLQEGQGYPMIAGLFALQDAREKDIPLFTAERIGGRAVDGGLEIDLDDPKNPLFHCIDTDPAVLARITAHQKFAEGPNYKLPTVAVYHATHGEPDLSRKPLFADANTPINTLITYVAQQAAAEVTK